VWQGHGTQEGWTPYPVCLEFTKIKNNVLEGTCDWETLRGTTQVIGEMKEDVFSFTEVKVLRGGVAIPNHYEGTRFGNCALFAWQVYSMRGCAYGVMKDVARPEMNNYLKENEVWEGVLLNPKGTAVVIQLSVLQVNGVERKIKMATINSPEKIGSFKTILNPEIVTKEMVLSLSSEEKMYDNPASVGANWLDWAAMRVQKFEDAMIGWVTYARSTTISGWDLRPSEVIPFPYNRDNLIYLKKIK